VTFDAVADAQGQAQPRFVLARVAGPDKQATVDAITADYTSEMATNVIPSRVATLHRVLPLLLLGGLLAGVLGAVLIGYTLAVSTRARRRELALLRALGLSTRHVTGILAWQGMILALAITLIGIPLGLLAGSLLWRYVEHGLAVFLGPVVPSRTPVARAGRRAPRPRMLDLPRPQRAARQRRRAAADRVATEPDISRTYAIPSRTPSAE